MGVVRSRIAEPVSLTACVNHIMSIIYCRSQISDLRSEIDYYRGDIGKHDGKYSFGDL
jgi:hypothetical protein